MNYIETKIEDELKGSSLQSFRHIYRINRKSKVRFWFYGIGIFLVILLFIPWTQNIRSIGSVTTLRQEQRPQQINSIIPGKLTKWYVKEGDFVKAGDTLVQLSEIKDDYFDPQLLNRTQEQLVAKELAIENYKQKAQTADQQVVALQSARDLKLAQLQNKIGQQRMKVRSDSMEMLAARNDLKIATDQFRRQKNMYDSGLVSMTQLEQRNIAFQNATAKNTSAEIKFMNAKQELNVLQLEMNGAIQEYSEKISKASGDKFQSMSQVATGEGDVSKLKNQYSNYDRRLGLYFVTAPQDGQVVKARKAGIGEILKEGEMLVEIVPTRVQYAVELYVRPLDLPLLEIGQNVRFLFDGFPAVVFSGWPQASYGTFGGKIAAIESSVSDNGKFRILVAEDSSDRPWPKQLRIGTGAQGMALLKDVPIWYELWRNINGFPPDYYKTGTTDTKEKKK
jgi:multidrug resistance efflux pump